jgi:hypothetical protein
MIAVPRTGKKKPVCVSPGKYTKGCPCSYCSRKDRETPVVETVQETITKVEEHRLKRQVKRLEDEVKTLITDLSDARSFADLQREAADAARPKPITPRETQSGLREATALVCASDWHIEEPVDPATVANRNRYNLEISEQRMTRFFEATRWAIDNNRHAFKVRDCILWLGGDIITNYLHEDNQETNLLSPVEAIAYADTNISAGINHLLKDPELERIVIPCNDGNHGRLTKKTRHASRVANSIEWLLYTMLARRYANEPRVQFDIAQGPQLFMDVYGRTIRFTHGDTTKYGGGVGGITIPINKAIFRWNTTRRADLTVMGHYHQYMNLRHLIMNGSLIGFNAYAMGIGAEFEPPTQAFQLLDSKRFNLAPSTPLWVASRKDDQG